MKIVKPLSIFLYVFVCLLFLPGLLFPFEWPLHEKRVVSTFGQDIDGDFNTGINLLGKDEAVYPIAGGEVIFAHDEFAGYSSFPRGAGSFVILYHEGEIQSVYSHLKQGSLQIPPDARVTRQDSLGTVGSTGASLGGALFLQIIDVEENMLLNPLKQLTPEIEDKVKPTIERVLLVRDNVIRTLVSGTVLPPGQVSLLIGARDLRQDPLQSFQYFAPYSITLSQNGVEVFSLIFDVIKVKDGRFVLGSTGHSFLQMYTSEGLINLGDLNLVQGITRFRFSVGDYAAGGGNSRAAEYEVTVAGE